MKGLGRSSRGGVMVMTGVAKWEGIVFGFLALR